MKGYFSSPFRAAIWINLICTLILAALAGMSAVMIIDHFVERTEREEISRDIKLLTERNPHQDALPELASLSTAISQRMFQHGEENIQSLFLLADAEGRIIVGNAAQWPRKLEASDNWHRIDGARLGISKGPVIARTVSASNNKYKLLVGRKLTAKKALLNWFIPLLILSVLALGLLSAAILGWLNKNYQNKIRLFNSVFSQVENGDISARISEESLQPSSSELSRLGTNINIALSEVQRFMAGLDSYSQVAAHELNHAVSKMRERFIANGNTQSVKDSNQLLELVSQILHLVKIESSPEFAMQMVNLREIAQSVADLFADTLEDKNIHFKCDFDDGPFNIQGSNPLIASAITNLMSNAAKHAPASSTITLSLTSLGTDLTLAVHDEGPGVSTTDIGELAERGKRGESGGYGFGLRHVQAVAIRHGARLTLQNTHPGLKASLLFSKSGRR